jgi:hypothetical protein
MVALTAGRNTPQLLGTKESHPVKAGVKIFVGALVCLDANGWAVPGSTATTLTVIGRAEETIDNTSGANGDLNVKVARGRFRWANSAAGDLIARTEIGKTVYIVDDQTVAKTNGTNTRSAAGIVRDVDAQGVWVES